MSVPNGTSVGQETDQEPNYGTFKPCVRRNRNLLLSYRQSKYHIMQALLRKKAATIKIVEGCDDDDEDGENVIEINSGDEEATEEVTRPDLCLVYPFAASREKIEGATQGLIDAIVEAPLNTMNLGQASSTQDRSFVLIVDQDVERLNPTRWLNDSLVDFWMMW
jgi:hypothetical protein